MQNFPLKYSNPSIRQGNLSAILTDSRFSRIVATVCRIDFEVSVTYVFRMTATISDLHKFTYRLSNLKLAKNEK